jgi:phytoene dehydrogenase-like protein
LRSYDAIIVGGGHNGLVAAAYLARAGRSVLVLERLGHMGGAAVSERPWAGVDARISRYSYLVSLLPERLTRDLGLSLRLRRRAVASYTPRPDGSGLLIRAGEAPHDRWRDFYAMTARVGRRVFPTLTRPLPTKAQLRAEVGEDAAWEALFERPLGEVLAAHFPDDIERGVALTDGLIGTFASADEPSLRQNRCFLYHVIGNGTGDWDVPIGGMGAVTGALTDAAAAAGAELRCGVEVSAIAADGVRAEVRWNGGSASAGAVLANVAPAVLARLLDEPAPDPAPEGAQLKLNLLLSRLPRLRDPAVDASTAFSGTFHVNQSASQLAAAHAEASAGRIPSLPPAEVYCHSLTDPTILGPDLRAAGAQTLTCFVLHMPARLFAPGDAAAKRTAVAATLRSLDSVLAEPIEDCLWRTGDGDACLEARTPAELEAELGLPGGNIFHRELAWPYAEAEHEAGRWGVETQRPNVLICGAGARRGGGVSGIPGHNAAMALLHG